MICVGAAPRVGWAGTEVGSTGSLSKLNRKRPAYPAIQASTHPPAPAHPPDSLLAAAPEPAVSRRRISSSMCFSLMRTCRGRKKGRKWGKKVGGTQ